MSYLRGRKMYVNAYNSKSRNVDLPDGVPQGSILGLLLFIMYTASLSTLIRTFDVKHHCYADDTQLYVHYTTATEAAQTKKLQDCINGIVRYMSANKLRLNQSRTETFNASVCLCS